MSNPTQDSQSELEKTILDDWLVHDEDCNYSYYGAKCNCIQKAVAKNLIPVIEAYVTTRVKEAERLARVDELEQMSHINFVASTVVPRVSTDNRSPVKRMSDHINERVKALTTTTNRKGE